MDSYSLNSNDKDAILEWCSREVPHYDCEDCWYSCAILTCDEHRRMSEWDEPAFWRTFNWITFGGIAFLIFVEVFVVVYVYGYPWLVRIAPWLY